MSNVEPDKTLILSARFIRDPFSKRLLAFFQHPRTRPGQGRSYSAVYEIRSICLFGCEGCELEEVYVGAEGGGPNAISAPVPIGPADRTVYLTTPLSWVDSPQNQLVIALRGGGERQDRYVEAYLLLPPFPVG